MLVSRPTAEPSAENFRLEKIPVPTPASGEILLRTIWLSLDPYMRGRMSDAPSYAAPVAIGGVMEGGTVSEVVVSNNPDYKAGDIVLSRSGWQTHEVSSGKGLRKLDPNSAPPSYALGILGMPGMTAYFGLKDIGKPQAGENAGGRGGVGRGRLRGRADREAPRRAGRWHRGRRAEMPVRHGRTRLRCVRGSPRAGFRRASQAGVPERHRRLLRERRRQGVRRPCSRCSTRMRACRCAA